MEQMFIKNNRSSSEFVLWKEDSMKVAVSRLGMKFGKNFPLRIEISTVDVTKRKFYKQIHNIVKYSQSLLLD